jgi:hypothetical protein
LTDRTTKIAFDLDQLLAFYDFPGRAPGASENYQSVESTFATVRNRSKITKGPGSRAAGIAMAYKLIEAAQSRRRAVNAPTRPPSSAPEPDSRTANPSNDATSQEVEIKRRNTPIHSLEDISGKPISTGPSVPQPPIVWVAPPRTSTVARRVRRCAG